MSFKVIQGSDVRRVAGQPKNLAELRQVLLSNIKPVPQEDFVIKYQDPEGDMITVDTEEDFKFMVELLKGNLKIYLGAKNAPIKPPSSDVSLVIDAVEAPPVPAPVPVIPVVAPVEPPKPTEAELLQQAIKKAEEEVAAVKDKIKALKGPTYDLKVKRAQLAKRLLDIQLAKLDLDRALVTSELTHEKVAEFEGKLANLKKEKKQVKELLNNQNGLIADRRLLKKKLLEELEKAQTEVNNLKKPDAQAETVETIFDKRCKVFSDLIPHLTLEQIRKIVQDRPYCTDEELIDIFLSFEPNTLQLGKK